LPAKNAPKKNRSALKRVRQARKRALRNRSVKSTIKTFTKKVEAAVKDRDAEAARELLKKAVSIIDKAARKGILHKNTAARKVSRLSRLVNSLS
jgi:small subunit ribosomal protein S20